MFEVRLYKDSNKTEWNQFVENSKNGTFLFHRDYMDYHADRFADFSLLIYRKEKLYTILPANRKDNTLYSHQGLTYGGFLMSNKVTANEMLEVMNVTPTESEAWDIVQMEEIERELMDGDDMEFDAN